MMEIEQAVKRLNELEHSNDTEEAHVEADNIILDFVPEPVRVAYGKIWKWYS